MIVTSLINQGGQIKLIKIIEKINKIVCKFYSFSIFFMMMVVLYEVVMRYFFNSPSGWAYDTSWMLYGLVILGGAYTLQEKGHVRIDILKTYLPSKINNIVDIIVFGAIITPSMLILTYEGVEYATRAWLTNEKLSTTVWFFPAGPIKTIIPIGFGLLTLQSIVEFLKSIKKLKEGS